jgi:very-short-patch-repair endonuclease
LEINMTIAYSKKKYQSRRRSLRKNMPKAEVILWSKLKNRQLHGARFLRQYSVDQYIIDFYCPKLKLAIEVDGDSHFTIGAIRRDKERQEHIENYGIHFMRFTDTDIRENVDGVCESIYNEVEMRTK